MDREPDVGLRPRTPGSRPGPKAAAKWLSHLEIPLGSKFLLHPLRQALEVNSQLPRACLLPSKFVKKKGEC